MTKNCARITIPDHQLIALPCGHTHSKDMLRISGGLCPTCEENKDWEEMKEEATLEQDLCRDCPFRKE